jgi:hypothetical protein
VLRAACPVVKCWSTFAERTGGALIYIGGGPPHSADAPTSRRLRSLLVSSISKLPDRQPIRGVELLATRFDKRVKALLDQQPVQPLVEGMTWTPSQLAGLDLQGALLTGDGIGLVGRNTELAHGPAHDTRIDLAPTRKLTERRERDTLGIDFKESP